ncbi:hypothetical protein GYMLUDRAFT_265768 [Collybiopsis luxurians FD-317 M1]|uniref:Peptidase C14 caspase domain-containing protein n=1 Tax=Collybiopsis luxurians FD-317 M1 TaxID=944289 RepID=A0A0D0AMX4_9AGAR|nr:hypothetical protein GYMLUDRAFT_265768 [Collybiopsis luxurians FD-317 M1]
MPPAALESRMQSLWSTYRRYPDYIDSGGLTRLHSWLSDNGRIKTLLDVEADLRTRLEVSNAQSVLEQVDEAAALMWELRDVKVFLSAWMLAQGPPKMDEKLKIIPTPNRKSEFNPEKTWVIIVGIHQYYSLRSLPGAAKDAKDIHSWVLNALKVPVTHVRLLLDASRSEILYELHDHFGHASEGDTILFYYAGHGSSYPAPKNFIAHPKPVASIEAICPVDRGKTVPDISDRELNGIFANLATKCGTNNITVILDCCYSGGMGRHAAPPEKEIGSVRTVPPMEDGLSQMLKAADRNEYLEWDILPSSIDWVANAEACMLIAASQDHEAAMEDPDSGGFFTQKLLAFLKGHQELTFSYEELLGSIGSVAVNQHPLLEGHNPRDLFLSIRCSANSQSGGRADDPGTRYWETSSSTPAKLTTSHRASWKGKLYSIIPSSGTLHRITRNSTAAAKVTTSQRGTRASSKQKQGGGEAGS